MKITTREETWVSFLKTGFLQRNRTNRGCVCVCVCVYIKKEETKVAQLCPTLCDPMDYSLPGSSIHEIFQARVLEWVAISFSRGSSGPRD